MKRVIVLIAVLMAIIPVAYLRRQIREKERNERLGAYVVLLDGHHWHLRLACLKAKERRGLALVHPELSSALATFPEARDQDGCGEPKTETQTLDLAPGESTIIAPVSVRRE